MRHRDQDVTYEAAVARFDADEQSAAKRRSLARQRVELSTGAARLADLHGELAAKTAERAGMVADLAALRSERFAIRRRVCDELRAALGPAVRVSIEQGGSRADYEEKIAAAVDGARLRRDYVATIARRVRPEELAQAAEALDVDALVAADDMMKTGKEDRAMRLLRALVASEKVFDVETAELDDLPVLELETPWGYQPSGLLSPGQRCSLVLPILLLDDESPLVLDQPEDNLGGLSTYEHFVKRVRALKGRRQIIVATHSPNVPMLADADRVFVLGSDARRGGVAEVGAAPDLAATIERLLDGGPEAFLGRWRRYGYGGTESSRRE